ncbi:MAG: hypothetical protein HPY61_12285 [Methanotrichaceae archaeon]|nr:hypothetical protein [Methanotrichaceae archaeon]
MHSTTESIESPLDVIVHFSEQDWERANGDISWATHEVIAELKKYKDHPESYFATKPAWLCRFFPWESRIRLEIQGHMWTHDRHIRFSEWWIVKLIR